MGHFYKFRYFFNMRLTSLMVHKKKYVFLYNGICLIDFGNLVFFYNERYRIDAFGIQIYPVYILKSKSTCFSFLVFFFNM